MAFRTWWDATYGRADYSGIGDAEWWAERAWDHREAEVERLRAFLKGMAEDFDTLALNGLDAYELHAKSIRAALDAKGGE